MFFFIKLYFSHRSIIPLGSSASKWRWTESVLLRQLNNAGLGGVYVAVLREKPAVKIRVFPV